ncbi:hypothetical protein [Rubritalea tangerina]|uniref:Uncharacterized protein n=1 Tax=Rubritalea tangerina TaxID=430798 RepID=A0ABW4ZCH7_9BACT
MAASLASVSVAQSAKLVSVTAAAGVPEGADFQVKPMGYAYGVTLHFFVTGENMISFDKESLEADGWELGPFPKVGDDGTQGSFSIHKKGDFLGKVDAVKAEGSVVVFTGKETKTVTQKLKVGDKALEMGPYKVNAGKSKSMFGGEGVTVVGEIEKIKEIKVTQNGKELDQQGSSWSGKSKTFNIGNLKGEVEVKLVYWPTLTKSKVSFSK